MCSVTMLMRHLIQASVTFLTLAFENLGARGGVVVKALRFKPAGRRFKKNPVGVIEFFQ